MKKSELDLKEKEIPVIVSVLKDEEIQGEPEGGAWQISFMGVAS